MSIVSTSIVGTSIIFGGLTPSHPTYNYVKLYGNSIVDKLRVVDYAMTTEELDALAVTDVYVWDQHTLLYAEFTNNLDAGSISVPSTIDSWTIMRYCCDSNIPTVIATNLDGDEDSIVDYTAIKPRDYYYVIYPITATAVISYIQSNTITECYDFYAILDPTTGESFTFRLNLDSGNKEYKSSVSTYEGFTQYPAKSQGAIRYNAGTLSALLGDVVSSTYSGDDTIMFAALEQFITNGNEKYLKDRKGNIYKVSTENLNSNMDEKPPEIPTTISFQWTQVGEV